MPRLLAQTVALNRVEELKLLGMAAARSLPDRVRMGPFDWDLSVTEAATEAGFVEATVRATSPGQPGATFVVYVTPRPQ
jgi:general secretion pathway protein I